jgi:hypothetical protein
MDVDENNAWEMLLFVVRARAGDKRRFDPSESSFQKIRGIPTLSFEFTHW